MKKANECIIRESREDETGLLKDFLYEAIYVPKGMTPPSKDIVEKKELRVYTDGFGREKADHCLVAEADNEVIGMVWSRIMDDYGHIDDDVPSLAISLKKEYRHKGIGTELMKKMLEILKDQGYEKVSLAVQKANTAAVSMYKKVGFRIIDENDEEFIMEHEL